MGFNTDSQSFELGEDVFANCKELRSYIGQIERASNLVSGKPGDPTRWVRERVRPCDLIYAVRERVGPPHLGMFLAQCRDGGPEHWGLVLTGVRQVKPDDTNSRALTDVGIIIDNDAPPYRGAAPALLESLPGLLEAIGDLLMAAEQEPDPTMAQMRVQMAACVLAPIWTKFVEHQLVPNPTS